MSMIYQMKLNYKSLDELNEKYEKMNILNTKVSMVLPELMTRNIKLTERLKNKLKVSTLFNNIEHRNKKYLKGFISSSNKRVSDLKTGLDMDKAIKQSQKKLTLLCCQMKGDLILKNTEILLKEKKLLNENTEQETHLKINNSLRSMKNALKPIVTLKSASNKKLYRSMSDEQIKRAKNIVGYNISKEGNDIQELINNYIIKMRKSFDNKEFLLNKLKIRKDFNKFIENVSINNNKNKLIFYKKPKPQQINDKESANLIRIQKLLYPSNFDIYINSNKKTKQNNYNQINKKNNNNEPILKKNSSMNDIYINLNNNNNNNQKDKINSENKLNIVKVNGKDTMEVLNELVDQEEFLSERLENKLKRVNSLIEFNLPYPSSYELILKYNKKKPRYRSENNSLNYDEEEEKKNKIIKLKNVA